jgi:hypothetical protein
LGYTCHPLIVCMLYKHTLHCTFITYEKSGERIYIYIYSKFIPKKKTKAHFFCTLPQENNRMEKVHGLMNRHLSFWNSSFSFWIIFLQKLSADFIKEGIAPPTVVWNAERVFNSASHLPPLVPSFRCCFCPVHYKTYLDRCWTFLCMYSPGLCLWSVWAGLIHSSSGLCQQFASFLMTRKSWSPGCKQFVSFLGSVLWL